MFSGVRLALLVPAMLKADAPAVSTVPSPIVIEPVVLLELKPIAAPVVKMLRLVKLFAPEPPLIVTACAVMRVPLVPRFRVAIETLPFALLMLTPVLPTPPAVEPAVTVAMLIEPPVVPSTLTARWPAVFWVIVPE